MTLYVLQYNSYYNRIVKREQTLENYMQYVVGEPYVGINFNPNNGVDTIQYVNCDYNQLGDYVLCVEDGVIVSRWFIVEAKRERSGQYRLQLRRDLLVDYYDNIANSPCFIKKATLQSGDPLIFNSENMTFNQIKTSETLLKDETGVPWIVGFVPKNAFQEETEITSQLTNPANAITVSTLENWDFYKYVENYTRFVKTYRIYNWAHVNNNVGSATYGINYNGSSYSSEFDYGSYNSGAYTRLNMTMNTPDSVFEQITTGRELVNNWLNNIKYIESQLGAYETSTNAVFGTYNTFVNIKNLNGKYIFDTSTSKFYKISVEQLEDSPNGMFDISQSSNLGLYLDNQTALSGKYYSATFTTERVCSYICSYTFSPLRLHLTEVSGIDVNVKIDANRYHLIDQPFDMFAMPYGSIDLTKDGIKLCATNSEISTVLAIAIGEKTGTDNIYDLQLLPYCPLRYMNLGSTIELGENNVNYIYQDNNVVGVIFWANNSSFSFDIPLQLSVSEPKIESECDMYRLVSPNYNGQFEFNLAKNGGLNYINVDCTYKPYDSYIHLNPNFGQLYGQDFNDARGLICGGDFSLPQVSNAWANYQLNNKNYQASFDRQIQNLELKNWTQSLQDKASLVSGAIQGGVSGFASGGVGGMAVGLIGSATTGALDYSINETLRNEAIDYTIDQFGYTLGNIQAMPNSLMKTSALTYNNKLFPILEYYTCTDKEKQALRDKLKYNGMTVMAIGTIAEYNAYDISYIQGQLIRLEGVHEDFHLMNEIASEINKGAYFVNG